MVVSVTLPHASSSLRSVTIPRKAALKCGADNDTQGASTSFDQCVSECRVAIRCEILQPFYCKSASDHHAEREQPTLRIPESEQEAHCEK